MYYEMAIEAAGEDFFQERATAVSNMETLKQKEKLFKSYEKQMKRAGMPLEYDWLIHTGTSFEKRTGDLQLRNGKFHEI